MMKKTLFVILIGCLNTTVAAETQDKSNIIPKANLAASTDEQEATIQSSIILTDTPTQLPVYAVITPSYNQPYINPFVKDNTPSHSMPAQQNVQATFNKVKAANQRIFDQKQEAARLIEEKRLEAERERQKAAKEEQDRKHNMALYQQVIIPSLQGLAQQNQNQYQEEVEEKSPPPKGRTVTTTVTALPIQQPKVTVTYAQDSSPQTPVSEPKVYAPPPSIKCSRSNSIGGFVTVPNC